MFVQLVQVLNDSKAGGTNQSPLKGLIEFANQIVREQIVQDNDRELDRQVLAQAESKHWEDKTGHHRVVRRGLGSRNSH